MLYRKQEIIDDQDLEKWKRVIFSDFEATLTNKNRPFPCLFGVNGYTKDMLRFCFYETLDAESIADDLAEFCENYKSFGKQTSLVLFEKPYAIQSIEEYYHKFWKLLNELTELDTKGWPHTIPKDPDDYEWEFCFHGVPMFIVCNTPAHLNRLSRNSRSFMLTVQPRWVFEDILGTETKAHNAFSAVRQRLEPYDISAKSRFLGLYGDQQNREWKQYFLDDGEDAEIKCPYTCKGA